MIERCTHIIPCNDNQCHGGEYHKAVVGISCVVERLWHNLVAKQCAAAEKFAEESYDYQYDCVAYAVANPVEK